MSKINNAVATLTTTLNKGHGEFGPFNADAIDYFRKKLAEVTDGIIGHAGNPHGYFIIGAFPQSRRGAALTIRQFEYCLSRGYTNKAHLVCRGLSESVMADSAKAVGVGVYASFARNNSSLGDRAMRDIADGLSRDARKGNNVSNKASALLLALTDADAAEDALAFIRQSAEKLKTAISIGHEEWLDSIVESIPNFESSQDQDEVVTHWVTGILDEMPEITEEDERILSDSVRRVTKKKKAGK